MPGILDSQTFSIFEFFENFVKFLNSAWTIKFQNFIAARFKFTAPQNLAKIEQAWFSLL